jgi:hypothetical protein
MTDGWCLNPPGAYSPARASYDDFSNTGTPQNRDSYESAAVGCSQLLFESVAIRLKGFQRNL